jgi:hypothetical protein
MKTWKHWTFVGFLAIIAFAFVLIACDPVSNDTDNKDTDSNDTIGGQINLTDFFGTWYCDTFIFHSRICNATLTISMAEIYYRANINSTGELYHSYTISNLTWYPLGRGLQFTGLMENTINVGSMFYLYENGHLSYSDNTGALFTRK